MINARGGLMSDEYRELEERARAVGGLLRDQARRAFVLEITGTPKAGKTSTIQLVESFFKAAGWRVEVLRERAGLCPIPMKGHFFFNTWTTCTMLAGVLEQADRKLDLLILDRGFFDALIWLELQRERGQVTAEEAEVFAEFVLLERWRQLVDLTVVVTVPAEIALEREQIDRMVPRRGSVMNQNSLEAFNAALEEAREKYGQHFNIEPQPSDERTRKQVAAELVEMLLPKIEAWADPPIAVLPRPAVERAFGGKKALSWPAPKAWDAFERDVKMVPRSTAEKDDSLVQIVAGGVVTHERGVFVFDRKEDEKRLGEYERHTIWRGAHVDHGSGDPPLLDVARDSLVVRLRTDLHLNFEIDPKPLGIVWVPDRPRSAQHLGLIFEVHIEDEAVADSLEDKEFKTGRGHPARSSFVSLDEIGGLNLDLESWSKAVLEATWLRK
jgi:predicted NUDIX family phosphoesterase/thymidylate kinase